MGKTFAFHTELYINAVTVPIFELQTAELLVDIRVENARILKGVYNQKTYKKVK